MKHTSYLTTIFFCFVSLYGHSQSYTPVEQKIKMGKTLVNAWVVSLENESLDDLKDEWTAYVKESLDVKVKKQSRSELVAKKILAPRIYHLTGDLRAMFFSEHDRSSIAVAFMSGYDLSLNSVDHPREAGNLRHFTQQFIKTYKTDQITDLLEEEEKRERSLESEYERHERERTQLVKHIARVDRKLNSSKVDEGKRFELKNEKVTTESKVRALDEIMSNYTVELGQIKQVIQRYRADLQQLNALFAEPLADQPAHRR